VWITVGTATSGTGNLSSIVSSRLQIDTGANYTTAYSCPQSGAVNRLNVALFTGSNEAGVFFSLERTKDTAGADSSTGILLSAMGRNLKRNIFIPFSGAVYEQADTGILLPTGVTTGVYNTDVGLARNFHFKGGIALNPGINHLGYFHGDHPAGSQLSLNVDGTNRNYYFLGGNFNYLNAVARGAIANTGLAMLYE
jgi:hypothetical protein